MKNLIIRSLVLAFVLAAGAAMAQTTAQHEVSVTIPSIASIRIVDSAGDAVASPDGVSFAFDPATFVAGTPASPSNASFNWADVEVFVNQINSGWGVSVSTTGDTTFAWEKVTMDPSVAGVAPYNLRDGGTIISGQPTTTGWQSLGIDPAAYEAAFDGTEAPGTYTKTVTFTLSNP